MEPRHPTSAAITARLSHVPAARDELVALATSETSPGQPDERDLIGTITELEALKAAAAAAQARLTASLYAARRDRCATQAEIEDTARSTAAEIGLARHESRHRGATQLATAAALTHTLPRTLAALAAGTLSEHRATLVVAETSHLADDHRRLVDAELHGPRGDRAAGLGNTRLANTVRSIAQRLDPEAAIQRLRRDESQRRVSIRPVGATMVRLSALLPVATGIAAYAGLQAKAATLKGAGDPRSKGQLAADLLVESVRSLTRSGPITWESAQQSAADLGAPTGPSEPDAETPPVALHLVMTPASLLGRGPGLTEEPAHLVGHGPLPAAMARDLVRRSAQVFLRRLFTHPDSGQLVAMEQRGRVFTGALRRFLLLRDQTCSTPWCDAPISQIDHLTPWSDGGPTSADNAQGLCQACNLARATHPDRHRWRVDSRSVVTPIGISYTGRPPDPPGSSQPASIEERLRRRAG